MNESKVTMKTLACRKAEVRAKITRQHEIIAKDYWAVVAPVYRLGNSPLTLFGKFSTGFAVFQGIFTSLRLVWKIRKIFHR